MLFRAGLRCRLSHAWSFSCLARVVVSGLFVLCGARGSSQRGVCRQRFLLRTQATIFAALPGFQSSAIVSLTDGVACCRLTSHPSGRLRRHLIPALGVRAFSPVVASRLGSAPAVQVILFGLACVVVFRALGRSRCLARIVVLRIFLLRGVRGL